MAKKPATGKPVKKSGAAKKSRVSFSVEDSHAYYIYSLQSLSYAALAEALRPHDLTPPAWRVLANLQENDEIGVRDLARRTVVDVSNLSKLITAMTDRGFLRKKRSPADARVTLVYITSAGRRKFETALPAVRGVLDHNLAGFSDVERDDFLGYLRRMMKNANTAG
jgi:DNA-binding MarR family transcriptional regulator